MEFSQTPSNSPSKQICDLYAEIVSTRMGTRVAKIDNVEFALGKHVQLRFEGLVEETEVTLG
jgi:hypothetical protein